MTRAAAFLDRDGVINTDRGYVARWQDFEFCPGAIQALERLQAAGYLLVLVSNQSGVARGFFSEADVQALHAQLQAFLALRGVQFSSMLYCPHLPPGQATAIAYARVCHCRKPAPGMFLAAQEALDIDFEASVMFGDKASDIEAANRAGVAHGVLLDSGERTSLATAHSSAPLPRVSARVVSLSAGVDWWLARAGRPSPQK